MKRNNFTSRESVRRELVEHHFINAHARPGRPEPWTRLSDPSERYAIVCENGRLWHIVPYPELDNEELMWLES